MSISAVDLAKARDSASSILQELQLDAFIYEVEPRDDVWELTIECACKIDGSWKTYTLRVPKRMLLDSVGDDMVKQHLFEYWKKLLADCKQSSGVVVDS